MPQMEDGQSFDQLEPSTEGLGGADTPLRVAIVGSGPSGFYAADALFKSDVNVTVAMFEKLPTPFGLVRFGVAPDHAKIRNVTGVFAKTAAHEDFTYWGNVTVGNDISVAELREHFDVILLAFGAQTDRSLGIPGEDLSRSYTATAFCAWYNGHPEYRDYQFDLTHETAVVIGQGNVAMDVARVLALPADELAKTDMATHAVDQLRTSSVKHIHVVGRRGAVQAKFTPKEISELAEIPDCDLIIDPTDLDLSEADAAELNLPQSKTNQRNYDILKTAAETGDTGATRKIYMHFYKSPAELSGDGGVEQVSLEINEMKGEPGNQWAEGTGKTEPLECGVFFRSVGYKGVAIEGIPFDDRKGVVPNVNGRVTDGDQMYVAGWIKRGPSGLIGTNKGDSAATVAELLGNLPNLRPAPGRDDAAVAQLLADRGARVVTYEDWTKIDAAEIERGKAAGKPRDNFTRIDDMLALLDG